MRRAAAGAADQVTILLVTTTVFLLLPTALVESIDRGQDEKTATGIRPHFVQKNHSAKLRNGETQTRIQWVGRADRPLPSFSINGDASGLLRIADVDIQSMDAERVNATVTIGLREELDLSGREKFLREPIRVILTGSQGEFPAETTLVVSIDQSILSAARDPQPLADLVIRGVENGRYSLENPDLFVGSPLPNLTIMPVLRSSSRYDNRTQVELKLDVSDASISNGIKLVPPRLPPNQASRILLNDSLIEDVDLTISVNSLRRAVRLHIVPSIWTSSRLARLRNGLLLEPLVVRIRGGRRLKLAGSGSEFLQSQLLERGQYQIMPSHNETSSANGMRDLILELEDEKGRILASDKIQLDVQWLPSRARFRRHFYSRVVQTDKLKPGSPLARLEVEGVPVDTVAVFVLSEDFPHWLSVQPYGGEVRVANWANQDVIRPGNWTIRVGALDKRTGRVLAETKLGLEVRPDENEDQHFLETLYAITIDREADPRDILEVQLKMTGNGSTLAVREDDILLLNDDGHVIPAANLIARDAEKQEFPVLSFSQDRQSVLINLSKLSTIRLLRTRVMLQNKHSAELRLILTSSPAEVERRRREKARPIFASPLPLNMTLVDEMPAGTVVAVVRARNRDGSDAKAELKGDQYNLFQWRQEYMDIVLRNRLDVDEWLAKGVDRINVTVVAGNATESLAQREVRFQLLDLDDTPPQFDVAASPVKIDLWEGDTTAEGVKVFQTKITDPDRVDDKRIEVRLIGAKAELYRLNTTQQGDGAVIVTLLTARAIDREVDGDEHAIWIEAKDAAGHPMRLLLYIHIVDANDNAPRFVETKLEVFAHAGWPVGETVARLLVDDPDLSNGSRIVFRLEDEADAALGLFKVDAATGEVQVGKDLREAMRLAPYTIWISATDSGTPPLKSPEPAELRIKIEDPTPREDFLTRPLVFAAPSVLQVFDVIDDMPVGHTLFRVKIEDRMPATFSLRMLAGDEEDDVVAPFGIDEFTGAVALLRPLDALTTPHILARIDAQSMDGLRKGRSLLRVRVSPSHDHIRPVFTRTAAVRVLEHRPSSSSSPSLSDAGAAVLGKLTAEVLVEDERRPEGKPRSVLTGDDIRFGMVACHDEETKENLDSLKTLISIDKTSGEVQLLRQPPVLPLVLPVCVGVERADREAPTVFSEKDERTTRLEIRVVSDEDEARTRQETAIRRRAPLEDFSRPSVVRPRQLVDLPLGVAARDEEASLATITTGATVPVVYTKLAVTFTPAEDARPNSVEPNELFAVHPAFGRVAPSAQLYAQQPGVYTIRVGATVGRETETNPGRNFTKEVHLVGDNDRVRIIFNRTSDDLAQELRTFERDLTMALQRDVQQNIRVVSDQFPAQQSKSEQSSICLHLVREDGRLSSGKSSRLALSPSDSASHLTQLYQTAGVLDLKPCMDDSEQLKAGASPSSSNWSLSVAELLSSVIILLGVLLCGLLLLECVLTPLRRRVALSELAISGAPPPLPEMPTHGGQHPALTAKKRRRSSDGGLSNRVVGVTAQNAAHMPLY